MALLPTGATSTLAGVISAPLEDPLQPEVVAVPTRGVERWLTQRLSTVQHADWILLLKDGQLVDQGSHQDLQQRSEVYRTLFDPAHAKTA